MSNFNHVILFHKLVFLHHTHGFLVVPYASPQFYKNIDKQSLIAIDSEGYLWVADSGNHRIQKFDSNGGHMKTVGTSGTDDGQFNSARDLAIDAGDSIYVVDRNNHRVQKFNSDGIYQSQFGSNGNGNSQFSSPIGIEFDSGGNIFVTDTGNNRIQKFDPSGNFLNKFGDCVLETTKKQI